MTPAVERDMI